MAAHSSTLAWRIPWTEEPGGLQSMGSQGLDTTERLNHHHHIQSANILLRIFASMFIRNALCMCCVCVCVCVCARAHTQSWPTLCNPMDCSPLSSSVHGISKPSTQNGLHFFLQGMFPTQELNLCLLYQQADSLPLHYLGSLHQRISIVYQ